MARMVSVFVTGNPGSAYGTANMAASVLPPVCGLLVCLVCFQSAFKQKPKDPPDTKPDRNDERHVEKHGP
jgi:hypothetical protein